MAWKASFTHGISSYKESRLDEALGHFTRVDEFRLICTDCEHSHSTQALTEMGGDQQHIIYDSRAAVYEKLRMPKEALRDAKAVITLAQDQWQGYARSARLFLLAHRFDASLKMANMALERVKSTNMARRSEISKLRDEILEAQQAEEKRKRAAQNQFEKLPIELVVEIFRLAISSNEELIDILRVCRYWRNVAWHAPSLWETLVLTPKSPARKLLLWTKRSKGRIRELEIRAGVASHIDWPFQEIKDLPWDKLRVCKAVSWDVVGYLEKHGLVTHAFEALETLEMSEERTSQRRTSASLFPLLQTTGIHSLSFSNSRFSWKQLSAHLTTLTMLSVRYCSDDPEDLLPTLEANPGLETLIIQDHFLQTWPANTALVALPHLKHLEFYGNWASRLLEVITTPALEVLKVKGSRDALDRAFNALTAALIPTNLTHLTVDSSPVAPASLIRLLKHAPALIHLEITHLSKGPNAVVEALAGTPSPSSPGKHQSPKAVPSAGYGHILCPSLTSLNLSHSPDVRTGPLVRLVRARLPPKPTPATDDAASAPPELDASAIIVDEPEPAPAKGARILSLELDECEQIDGQWLQWFRDNVSEVKCKFNLKKKAVWKYIGRGKRDWPCASQVFLATFLNLIVAASDQPPDFYELLSLPKDASAADIKIAYHRALLRFHPDKNHGIPLSNSDSDSISVSLIREAYSTLSEPERRKQYDSSKRQRSAGTGPRPAQVVSLEEFEEVADDIGVDADVWQYQCRCGGTYRIAGADMEKGHHLVGCNSCSEVVWVGYELQTSDEDEDWDICRG
ncbi:hypothetical protein FPV67DRAFT_1479108 [Lyophyllum atratum]|nr:hypothetical protein FPV67DRAFT_1479108 [Lyophyllum atratum]